MAEKKEVQEKIIRQDNNNKQVTEEEFLTILRSVAPGTNFRTALEGALKTGKGALIVVENDSLAHLLDGGFRINCRFTPQRLIELTKMDGAIILSKDLKRIQYANVLLTPDSRTRTSETGTRHKAGERTAKQIGTLVIAISERKHEITLFYKNVRYPLSSSDELLRKSNEHIYLLEKQRELFDTYIEKLNKLEIRNQYNVKQAISVIQKGRLIQKIASDLKKYSIELGKESTLLKIRLKEITSGVERETDLIIKDYTKLDLKKSKFLLEELTYDEILDPENILTILGHEAYSIKESIKGWRILAKTSLTEAEIAQLTKEAGNLGKALHSNLSFLKTVFPEEKAISLKEEIDKIKLDI